MQATHMQPGKVFGPSTWQEPAAGHVVPTQLPDSQAGSACSVCRTQSYDQTVQACCLTIQPVHAYVQRLARPWDSPDVELTFKPKISARSKQLMAEARGSEGAAGFLDRLGNDMRRREAKSKVGWNAEQQHRIHQR